MEGVLVRRTLHEETLRRIELVPVTIDDEDPLCGVSRLASTRRGKEMIELLRERSGPCGTRIAGRG